MQYSELMHSRESSIACLCDDSKVIEYDPNDEAANIINNFIDEISDIDVKSKI